MSSQLCNIELNRKSLSFSLMSSSFCRSSVRRRTAVLNFEKIFFLNDLKDIARWFLFEVKLNIRLLSLSIWRTRLFFLNDQSIRLFFLNWLRTELLLMSELNIELPFQFNWITELFFSDEQRTEFLSVSRLSTWLLLESRLNSD